MNGKITRTKVAIATIVAALVAGVGPAGIIIIDVATATAHRRRPASSLRVPAAGNRKLSPEERLSPGPHGWGSRSWQAGRVRGARPSSSL